MEPVILPLQPFFLQFLMDIVLNHHLNMLQ